MGNLYDVLVDRVENVDNKLRVLSLFSGIGAPEKALQRLGVNYELVNYCEIDKYASKSYSVIHGISEELNLGDITKIDINKLSDFDLLTHGSPCQDFSAVGKQAGGDIGSETRSSLMWNTVEIIRHKKPKYVIWENVKNVLSKTHRHNFEKYIKELNELGYTSYHNILNASDYGIPQHRQRLFVISILNDTHGFEFPTPLKLTTKLKDLLEDDVDEKYNLKRTKDFFIKNSLDMESKGNGFRFAPHIKQNANISCCITTRAGGRMDDNFILDIPSDKLKYEFSLSSGNKEFLDQKWIENLKIRKLTPKECWRLMGFDDCDIDKCIAANISNTQLYKQAGNSIVVNVLEAIFKNLF